MQFTLCFCVLLCALGRRVEVGDQLHNAATRASEMQQVTSVARQEDDECRMPVDVIFVLDGSTSVRTDDWDALKLFVSSAVMNFEIGDDEARVGIVQFASHARTEMNLTDHPGKVFRGINTLKQMRGGTLMSEGLGLAKDMFTNNPRQARRFIFLVADGDVDAASLPLAREIEDDLGGIIFSVAVGTNAQIDALRPLASHSTLFYEVDRFDALEDIVKQMTTTACKASGENLGVGVSELDFDHFSGEEKNDEIVEQVSIQTDLVDECFLDETFAKFNPVFEHWTMLAGLAERLIYEEDVTILAIFQSFVKDKIANISAKLASVQSPKMFAKSLGKNFRTAVAKVNLEEAQLTAAEIRDFMNLGLYNYVDRGTAHQQESLKQLEGDLCSGMKTFMKSVAAVQSPLYQEGGYLWHMWQEAWGPVRIFVKVTTQCKVDVPRWEDANNFLSNKQDQWAQCKGAKPFPEGQFPSSVMPCARADDEQDASAARGPAIDRNRMIRFLGCGASRVRTEPPVVGQLTDGCLQSDRPEIKAFMTSLCGGSDISKRECDIYGPFWGVYSAPIESIYGDASYEKKMDCQLLNSEDPHACHNPQVEAFKGMINRAASDYIYGALPPLAESRSRGWQEGIDSAVTSWEPDMAYPLPQQRRLDPPLWEIMREAEEGNAVMMISYGFSGSGKTTTLIGDSEAPIGKGLGVDGLLSLYLQDNAQKISSVQINIFEVYGRVRASDGTLMTEDGSGLWAYRVQDGEADLLGSAAAFQDSNGNVDFDALKSELHKPSYTVTLTDSDATPPAVSVKLLLTKVEKLRQNARTFAAGGDPIAHIRGTVNNPKSSRGTLLVLTTLHYKSGMTGTISAVDLAGAEDPGTMVGGFINFMGHENNPQCTRPGTGADADMIQVHMHSMHDYDQMNSQLGECFFLREMLVSCDPSNPAPDCIDITLSNGRRSMVRPDSTRGWIHKSKRAASQHSDWTFTVGRVDVTFTHEEVMDAYAAGAPKGLSSFKKSTSPSEFQWGEHLWGRCIRSSKTGSCSTTQGARLDKLALDKPLKKNEYGFEAKACKDILTCGVPKTLIQMSGSERGKQFRNHASVSQWQSTRKRFFAELQAHMAQYEAQERVYTDDYELHLRYFTKAIGPLVQEAMFINEALNEMKGYLGVWAQHSKKAGPGVKLHDLWPPVEFDILGRDAQTIDSTPGSRISEEGYKPWKFIQSVSDGNYAKMLALGQDHVMLLTMLEHIRLEALSKEKDTKVLVGAFVRTDAPGADPNCDGTRASLRFAQDLSDAIGWRRDTPGALPHLY
eukprot:TRINITY_DN7111_c0_g1_i2.p1 TRINITY_DN7111_c0_g1~~TRINITY_DN7111_c0_g1_i2.p1  ORF type:complete len:1292 (+),score=228.55 TRINITY_DN7111_c0_g1_i2:65-3940(+)